MLRRFLWTGLYAGIGAAATMGARKLAGKIYRVLTGEPPPVKR